LPAFGQYLFCFFKKADGMMQSSLANDICKDNLVDRIKGDPDPSIAQ
jgi:hypothetical protein